MIIECSWIIPKRMSAITIGTFIFIKKINNRIDDALIVHEKKHVEQFKKQPFTFWIKYLFSRECRCQFEVEAYAWQIGYLCKSSTARLNDFINYFTDILYSGYKLNYEKIYINALIKQECYKLGLPV